jgi:diaminohydroxyphosphoribosylaminopyrimidine deaminase/5-amino-6-(5-phosphoribosylamino)uracil reductase
MGAGNVAPNPMVGAVLVYQNNIIGEGFHREYGGGHAEVNCIHNVSHENRHLIEKSTLYVSLEPCNHHGKTPPCTDLIIRHAIPRVVIGCRDLNEKVNGSGVAKLRDSGIEVVEGICEKEAVYLNRSFFTFQQKKRPYVILKWAQSSDGFIGNIDKRVKISNAASDRLVHKWRSEEGAIMVGTKTAISDNPSLTTRLWPGHNPVRVVLDLSGKLPGHLALLNSEALTIVINKRQEKQDGNLIYRKLNAEDDLINEVLDILYRENIQSLIVEGGSKLLQTFIDSGKWDEARVIIGNNLLLESGVKAPALPVTKEVHKNVCLDDSILFFEKE